MADGMGCKCAASSECDCVCGVDWRSKREVELESENTELRKQQQCLARGNGVLVPKHELNKMKNTIKDLEQTVLILEEELKEERMAHSRFGVGA